MVVLPFWADFPFPTSRRPVAMYLSKCVFLEWVLEKGRLDPCISAVGLGEGNWRMYWFLHVSSFAFSLYRLERTLVVQWWNN
jgi:hypothetical protein